MNYAPSAEQTTSYQLSSSLFPAFITFAYQSLILGANWGLDPEDEASAELQRAELSSAAVSQGV